MPNSVGNAIEFQLSISAANEIWSFAGSISATVKQSNVVDVRHTKIFEDLVVDSEVYMFELLRL